MSVCGMLTGTLEFQRRDEGESMTKHISTAGRLAGGALALALCAASALAAVPASAAGQPVVGTTSGAVGGWSEATGAFGTAASGIGVFASPNHRGASEQKTINGTTNKRAHGWTTWAGVRHYTTAQLEHYWPASGVIASSGRKWGTGGTEAVSPWRAFNPNAASNGNGQARTYYGR